MGKPWFDKEQKLARVIQLAPSGQSTSPAEEIA
jgi:hypothetical protein